MAWKGAVCKIVQDSMPKGISKTQIIEKLNAQCKKQKKPKNLKITPEYLVETCGLVSRDMRYFSPEAPAPAAAPPAGAQGDAAGAGVVFSQAAGGQRWKKGKCVVHGTWGDGDVDVGDTMFYCVGCWAEFEAGS